MRKAAPGIASLVRSAPLAPTGGISCCPPPDKNGCQNNRRESCRDDRPQRQLPISTHGPSSRTQNYYPREFRAVLCRRDSILFSRENASFPAKCYQPKLCRLVDMCLTDYIFGMNLHILKLLHFQPDNSSVAIRGVAIQYQRAAKSCAAHSRVDVYGCEIIVSLPRQPSNSDANESYRFRISSCTGRAMEFTSGS